jgi:hypothetical protein
MACGVAGARMQFMGQLGTLGWDLMVRDNRATDKVRSWKRWIILSYNWCLAPATLENSPFYCRKPV